MQLGIRLDAVIGGHGLEALQCIRCVGTRQVTLDLVCSPGGKISCTLSVNTSSEVGVCVISLHLGRSACVAAACGLTLFF